MVYCLVVEDNEISRIVYSEHLKMLGFEQGAVNDGNEALESCRERMPDVVLLDWHMPNMDGFEFLDALRHLPGGDKPKVVLCTCDEEAKKHKVYQNSGVSGFLLKPTYFNDLEHEFKQLALSS